MREVLQILRENKFFARLPKCHFNKSELHFLGYVVSSAGIKVNPVTTNVVKEWPQPSNVSELRSFLGLANYFRKFVKELLHHGEASYQLNKEGCSF